MVRFVTEVDIEQNTVVLGEWLIGEKIQLGKKRKKKLKNKSLKVITEI